MCFRSSCSEAEGESSPHTATSAQPARDAFRNPCWRCIATRNRAAVVGFAALSACCTALRMC